SSFRPDYINSRLCLNQIDPSIQECTFSEFAGLSKPGTRCQNCSKDELNNQGATMTMYFDNIFTSEGLWCLHIDGHNLIENYISIWIYDAPIIKTVAVKATVT